MGHSEVSMKEGDTVELLKIGCAGWWYVNVLSKYNWKFLNLFKKKTMQSSPRV